MRRKTSGSRKTSPRPAKHSPPVTVALIELSDALATLHSGHAVHIADVDRASSQTIYNYLLTREQLRLDLQQVFVNRKEEDDAIVALHFPSHGRARQVKFRFPVQQELAVMTRDKVSWDDTADLGEYVTLLLGHRPLTPDEARFVEQALVDFEQLCANFIYAALPALARSAGLLARLNLQRATPAFESKPQPPAEAVAADDGFEEYLVNRDQGWPILRERFRLHDVVRLPAGHAKRDVDAGYLVPLAEAERNFGAWGDEYREAIEAYRERRAAEAAATQRRPRPTDTQTLLATSDGRKTRERIMKMLANIPEELFPPATGRPLARTAQETEALITELRADLNQRLASYITRNKRKSQAVIIEEMAADGRYGSAQESLSAATIKKLLAKGTQRRTKSGKK
jgi:hypothetical protein